MIARSMAAFSFAALVVLAVGTAGVRIASWRLRARLDRLDLEVRALRYETTHGERAVARSVSREALTSLLQARLDQVRAP